MAAKKRRWQKLSTAKLLDMRISDLGLRIEGTALERRLERLWTDLERRGLAFRPYAWLSTDWMAPDGLTGFAIPFYMAHPRLLRLEHKMMLAVEGGSQEECMKLLRHEAAHAFDNAYGLRRKASWRAVFGRASEPYRQTYLPRTSSRDFVQHLDMWYAQSHPLEDYAETFAVWLQPRAQWRATYRGWPALRKLQFVDQLMAEVADRKPRKRTRSRPDSVGTLRIRLRDYYARKQRLYRSAGASVMDRDLRLLFSDEPATRRRPAAAPFLARYRRELRHHVSTYTGKHRYIVDQVIDEMILRCRHLGLRLTRSERDSRMPVAILITSLTLNLLRGPRPTYQR